MKIKNVVFSGFAAAIFAGVCGAANAASVELISKPYADTNLQAKLTAGSNIAIDSQTNTISATGLATTTYVDEELAKKQNELQLGENLQWVDGKLDTKGIATADGLAELESKVNNAAQKSEVDAALALKADKTEIPSIDGLATSEELNTLRTTLEASIAEKQEKGEYLTAASLKELEDAVEALQTGKADASTVTTIQETISKLGDTYASKADMTAADQALQAAIDNMDLSAYAKVADVYSKTDADAKFLIMRDANALGANLQWNEEGKLDTKGIATADGLKELEDKVADAVTNTELEAKGYQTQTDVETLISGKADSTTVASDIATALQTAKDYADANDADTIYDDTQVKADIAANTQAIANIKEYDDTALTARVSANETGIADNKSAIEALQGAGHQTEAQVKTIVEGYGYQTSEQVQNAITTSTADMVTDAELAGKGYVVGTKTAGSYLVNFDAEGNASYAAVEILDDKGQPIDLTSGAVK